MWQEWQGGDKRPGQEAKPKKSNHVCICVTLSRRYSNRGLPPHSQHRSERTRSMLLLLGSFIPSEFKTISPETLFKIILK